MKIEDIIFSTLALVAAVMVLWYLFGNSPTIEQVMVALLAANVGFSFKINSDLQRHIGEHIGTEKYRKFK